MVNNKMRILFSQEAHFVILPETMADS